MPKNNLSKASDLNGMFIYQDPKKGTVYYDILRKKGYVLTSSDVKSYVLYSSASSVALVAAVFAYMLFSFNILTSFLVFLGVYIIMSLLFRFNFLYKLPEADNWKPYKKDSIFVSIGKSYSNTRLTILIILLILITILMPLYAHMANMDQTNTIASYIVSVLTGVYAIINVIALIKKKRDNT